MRRVGGLFLLMLTVPAFAGPGSVRIVDVPLAQAPVLPELEQAQSQLDNAEFEEAVKTLGQALNAPDVSDDQLVEIYKLLGLAHLYMGNEDKARDAYEKLLQARPDFELPRTAPPKIRSIYARIKEDIKKRRVRPVTITTEPVERVTGGEPLEIRAKIEDLALGSKPKLYYRRGGEQSYSSVDFVRDRKDKTLYRAIIPAFELPQEPATYDFEYYLEVADAAQRRLAGRGDAYAPQQFAVVAKNDNFTGGGTGEDSWYKNPWIWIGAGVLVAGAGVGVYFLANQRQTGSVTVTVTYSAGP